MSPKLALPFNSTPCIVVDHAQLLAVLKVVIRSSVAHGGGRVPRSPPGRRQYPLRYAVKNAMAQRHGLAGDGIERQVLAVAGAVVAPYRDENEGEEEEDEEGDDGGNNQGLRDCQSRLGMEKILSGVVGGFTLRADVRAMVTELGN